MKKPYPASWRFLFLDINFRGISFNISLDGKDLITSTTAVTAISIILARDWIAGPVNSADLSVLSKAALSVCMIVGRLEIYPIMLLCFSSFWKRSSI